MSVTINIHQPAVASHYTKFITLRNVLFIDLKRRDNDRDSNSVTLILDVDQWPAFYAELTAIDRALCPNPEIETPAPTSEKPE